MNLGLPSLSCLVGIVGHEELVDDGPNLALTMTFDDGSHAFEVRSCIGSSL